MAFASSGLSRIGGDGNYDLWMYASADGLTTVDTSGYFNDASNMLAVGDIVMIYDTATPAAKIAIVLSNASGVVDISDGTAITATDSR
jgi:hypothetical protein